MATLEDNPYRAPSAFEDPIPQWVWVPLAEYPSRANARKWLRINLLVGFLLFFALPFVALQWAAFRWMDKHDRWSDWPVKRPEPRFKVTLVEILVVLTILLFLGSIILPSRHRAASRPVRTAEGDPASIEP